MPAPTRLPPWGRSLKGFILPNRIIKESICTSDEIDRLSAEQEVFFYRLMVSVDDYGLIDARLPILKSKCYPLKSIDIKSIHANLSHLASVGLVKLYNVDGRPYLSITSWAKHQQIRAKRAKCPMPEDGVEINCNQMLSDAPVIQSNPIQSESNPNPNPIVGADKPLENIAAFVLPDWVDSENWNLWVKTRKKKMIAEQMQAQIKKLDKWRIAGLDHASALSNAAINGWQGLIEPTNRGGAPPSNSKQAARDRYDQQAREAHERIFGNEPTERDITSTATRIA